MNIIGATQDAISALLIYHDADEPDTDSADMLANALENMIRAASARDIYVAEMFDEYLEMLKED